MTCWSVFYHHKTPKVQSKLITAGARSHTSKIPYTVSKLQRSRKLPTRGSASALPRTQLTSYPPLPGRATPGATDDFQQYTFTCAAPEEQAKPLLDNEVSGQDGMCCQTPHLRFDGVPFHTTVITAPSAKPCALQSETSVGHYGQDVSASPVLELSPACRGSP